MATLNETSLELNIASQADITAARASMLDYIFGGEGIPAAVPTVTLNVSDGTQTRFAGIPGVAQIDKYTIALPGSAIVYAWRLRPTVPNGRLFIYHGGHGQGTDDFYTLAAISPFPAAGYDVVVMAMHAAGSDNVTGSWGGSHTSLEAAEANRLSMGYSTLRLFAEPVHQVLNLLAGDFDLRAMAGLSGGSWTTTLLSALDTRITHSYPVAGTMPWYLRTLTDRGDFEQGYETGGGPGHYTLPLFYSFANYEDQYVMACDLGRRQVQILNAYDAEAIAPPYGSGTPAVLGGNLVFYQDQITARVASIVGAGTWRALNDQTHVRHQVSPAARASILADLSAAETWAAGAAAHREAIRQAVSA